MNSSRNHNLPNTLLAAFLDRSLPADVKLSSTTLEKLFKIRKLTKGEHLCQAGDKEKNLYLVLSGCLRAYYMSPSGRECVRAFVEEEQVAGAFAEITLGIDCRVFVQATEQTTVAGFSLLALDQASANSPYLKDLKMKMILDSYIRKENHSFELTVFNGRERLKRFQSNQPGLFKRLRKSDIASYLNIAPETLSRYLKKDSV